MRDPASAEGDPSAPDGVAASHGGGDPLNGPEPHARALGLVGPGAPGGSAPPEGYADTSVFMRELSSLSDDPQEEGPVVTRLVVPLTDHRRKRRFWGR